MKIPKSLRTVLFPNLVNRDRWVSEIAKHVRSNSRVLDIGAGSAPYRVYFQHCRYLTQDAAQLDAGKLRGGSFTALDFVCDASSIPIPSGSIDVVLCTEVLEHVPEPLLVINEIGRLLAPGGVAYISAPLGSGIHQEPYHFYGGYTPYFYRSAAKRARLEVESIVSNGDSIMHFRQWLVWCGSETVRSVRAHPFSGSIVSMLMLPLLFILFLLSPLFRLAWRDERFSVGYHVILRKPDGA